MLRATGHPKKSMFTTLFSVLINIILAPIFIFVFRWGIRGAALATVIAQTSMLLWQILHFSNSRNFIHLKKGSFRLKRRIVTESLSIGMAPFMMNSVASIIVLVINTSLIRYGGDLAVGAYGIINRIAFLFIMVVLGFNQGMQPIAGYNHGAGQFMRVNNVLKHTIVLATSVMMVGFAIGELFPRAVASAFTTDQDLIDIVVPGMRIVMMSFPIIGFQMVTSNFFQSIGMPVKSILMSLSRQVFFLLPCLLIFPRIFGLKGIWYSMPTADVISAVVAAVLLVGQYRKNRLNEITHQEI
jgi:putative MATE family efflux protein